MTVRFRTMAPRASSAGLPAPTGWRYLASRSSLARATPGTGRHHVSRPDLVSEAGISFDGILSTSAQTRVALLFGDEWVAPMKFNQQSLLLIGKVQLLVARNPTAPGYGEARVSGRAKPMGAAHPRFSERSRFARPNRSSPQAM